MPSPAKGNGFWSWTWTRSATAPRFSCRATRSPNTVYDVYTEQDLHLPQCIHPTNYEQLDCLPNTQYTSALEPNLLRALPDSFRIIRQRIRSYVQDHYDYAILDCPPNMGFFVVSALQASDFVVVPIKSGSAFSVQGLMKAIELIHEIQETGNPDLRFLRLLINQVDRRTATSKVTIAQVQKHFSGRPGLRHDGADQRGVRAGRGRAEDDHSL